MELFDRMRAVGSLYLHDAFPYFVECYQSLDNTEKINDDVELWVSINAIINGGGPHCQSSEEIMKTWD